MEIKNEIHQFLLLSLFGKINDNKDAAIKRAYRDFNRTLKAFFKDDRDIRKISIKNKWNEIVHQFIGEILNQSINNQDAFDKLHNAYCEKLIKTKNEIYNQLTLGQAQKWLNMTLKYLIILEEKGIEKNMQFFHIPIDNVIQDILQKEYAINKKFAVWSAISINDYGKYIEYQNEIRDKFKDEYPILKELEIFNKAIASSKIQN